jgi:hypothetical protein
MGAGQFEAAKPTEHQLSFVIVTGYVAGMMLEGERKAADVLSKPMIRQI